MTFALQIAGVGFLVLVLSYLGVGCLQRWAEKHQILDIPNERSSHTLPTPRGGGIAIVFFSLIGFIAVGLFNPIWPFSIFSTYLLGGVLIAVVSWLDDLYSLPKGIRLTAHSLCAILAILSFDYFRSINIPFLGELKLEFIGLFITFLWIVGLTNAFNFMDGIDGIAGGQAVVAGFVWTGLGWLSGQPIVSTIGLFVGTSSLGFLGHNWPPARIFLGDVGSAFLGYTFAILTIIGAREDPRLALAGVLLVWPFLFDALFTFFRRLCRGENVFTAHRSHLYQRMVIVGYSHRFVSSLYIVLALIGGILAIVWSQDIMGSNLTVALCVPFFCLILWAFVNHQERSHTFDP